MKDNFVINSDFNEYAKVFLEENSRHNLISKNDEKYLYEKHIYDSLSIKLFFEKYGITSGKILDIGCGGGFPCVPLSIECPNFSIIGIDSIRKKIQSVEIIKNKLGLQNLSLVCGRVESSGLKDFDIIVSRAVGELSKILTYANPLLKKGGYFVAYKSKKSDDEIMNAKQIMETYNIKIIDIIDYTLPLDEAFERKLICMKKFKN